MDKIPFIGGAKDTQTAEQKALNYKQGEVVASVAPVLWLEKPRSTWKCYKVRNQDGSGTCVCQTYATEQSILFLQKYGTWIEFSSSFPYQQRSKPTFEGCNSTDVYAVFPKLGDVFELFMPSQNMNEVQIMTIKREPYFIELALPFTTKYSANFESTCRFRALCYSNRFYLEGGQEVFNYSRLMGLRVCR